MSTPIALSIDWVVQHILAAPLQKGGASYADDDVVNNDQERSFAWVVVGSRASAVTSATMTATTTTGSSRSSDNTTWVSLKRSLKANSDLVALVEAISSHRQTLVSQEEIIEFDS